MTATATLPRMRGWDMERRKKFAARLRQLRLVAGISQKEFARRVGIKQGRVSQWESGVNTPVATVLPRIAEALECTIEQLFEEPPEDVPTPQRGRPPKSPPDEPPPKKGKR